MELLGYNKLDIPSYMQNVKELLDEVLQNTTVHVGGVGALSFTEFLSEYPDKIVRRRLFSDYARLYIPENYFKALVHALRTPLDDYIDPSSDRIGLGMGYLMNGSSSLLIQYFARNLATAAIILDTGRAIQLLEEWIKGKPMRYQEIALLDGIVINEPLVLGEDIRIDNLPASPDELPASLLPANAHRRGYKEFLNGVILSVNCLAEPALYKSQDNAIHPKNFKRKWAQNKIPNLTFDSFCKALSLSSNHCIRWKFSWDCFGDLLAFDTFPSPGVLYNYIPNVNAIAWISQDHLNQAWDVLLAYHRAHEATKLCVDTALSRWVKSKQPESSISDRFIDLRVALEALYLDKGGGEISFRLATYGAWHTGENFATRKERYETLRKAYNVASKAVHAREVENTQNNLDLLKTTQDICRDGILKRLVEEQNPNWVNISLGLNL